MAKEGDKMVTSKRQLEYAKKYLGKFDEIKIRVPEGEKDKIKEYAVNLGESMNSFIISAINEAMTKKPATTENEIFGVIPNYSGTAVYALIDDEGKKYIGSTMNLNQRILFHASHIRTLIRDGKDGHLCAKMQNAILSGKKFRVEVLEMFPGGLSKEELNNKEYFYLEKEGGLDATYNMKPIKLLNCQPGDILEHVANIKRDQGE